ncbi:MAG: hypothetical protein IKF99_20915 [Oscillospiraceae bacterium]|nr:hypothetical protein [Oscillospiraceae bacterium]
MTMSVKMLNDIAVHAEGLASEAVAMAEALRAVVDDCAAQVAANRSPDNPTGRTDPEWVEDAQKNIVPPEAEPGKKLTIAEVRAYVAERTRPENRAQIRAILKSFGVAKLTELPEDKYEAMMAEVAKL